MNVTPWIKASASSTQGTCVWMRRNGDVIEVRGNDETGPVLRYTPAEINAWLNGAKNGEFDELAR